MKTELYQEMRNIEDRHWWFVGRRQIVATLLEDLALPDDAQILDLGCGTGGNLSMLGYFGQVQGLEMDPQAQQLARERGVAPIRAGSLPANLPVHDDSFDLITLLDVLEHVEQEEAALQSVHRLLKPGGRVLLTVPAFEFLWGPHDEAHHHFRRYRSSGLHKALSTAGFRVNHLSYFNTWLFPPIAAVRWFQKAVPGSPQASDTNMPPNWLNRLLLGLFASERHLVRRRRLPFGVSLIAVAQKAKTPASD